MFTICISVFEELKHPSPSFCKFLHKCVQVNKTCLHKQNWETEVQVWTFASLYTTIKNPNPKSITTTFATTKRNPNIPRIDQPSTNTPMCEHNHFRNVGNGIVSFTMHLKSGYCSNKWSFFLEKHKVTNEKPWPKEVQNVLILEFY